MSQVKPEAMASVDALKEERINVSIFVVVWEKNKLWIVQQAKRNVTSDSVELYRT